MIDRNIPYVKKYDAQGVLINPIMSEYKNRHPNRKERRVADGTTSERPFSNKKGAMIVVTKIGPYKFMKFRKFLIQQGNNDTRVMFQELKRKP